MPFVSKAQQKYMYSQHPEIAARWAKKTPDFSSLPEHVKKTALKNKINENRGQGGPFENPVKEKIIFPRKSTPEMPLSIKLREGSPGEPAKYRPDWMPQVPKHAPYDKDETRPVPPQQKLPKQLPKAVPKQHTADILQDILRKREHINAKL